MSFEEINEYYSEWWENPKDIRNVVFESLNKLIQDRIPTGEGKRALDIGSGHGKIVSYLVEKGYDVTAVDLNEAFCEELKKKFPSVRVLRGDIRSMHFNEDEKFDLTTCIELVQNLERHELVQLVAKLSTITRELLINISNSNSLHARWVRLRGWQKSFVYAYTPRDFERVLNDASFDVTYTKGVGLLTPISLFKDFKIKLLPNWLINTVNRFDPYFGSLCHLYYIEATRR